MSKAMNFLDTNILVYAFGEDKRAIVAQSLLAEPFIISAQALNEFSDVIRKRFNMSWGRIQEAVEDLVAISDMVIKLDEAVTLSALKLADRYNFSFYDATMVAAALQAGCERYFSEDLHHSLVVEGRLTVINPFR